MRRDCEVEVADLLECLIQLKGVADTPRRLERLASRRPLASGPSAAEVARALAIMETWFQRCLSAMLEMERPALPGMPADAWSVGEAVTDEWLARFETRRAETVARLDSCSAEQLNRVGIEPSRGPMTVADLVAVMLAHDTDALGALIAR